MIHLWLLGLRLIAIGPDLEPIEGNVVTQEDRILLPTTGHISNIADVWFTNIVNQQHGSTGIELFDPMMFSMHGRSFTQNKLLLNGLDITDPGTPGSTMFHVPMSLWSRAQFASLYTSNPGLEWTVHADANTRTSIQARGGRDVGGSFWLPRHLFDREPATDYGATSARRALREVQDIQAQTSLHGNLGNLTLFAEHLSHGHLYPTLKSPSTNQNLLDQANRTTVMAIGHFELGTIPFETLLGWQSENRSAAGAQYRFEYNLTQKQNKGAFIAQLHSAIPIAQHEKLLELSMGVAILDEDNTANSNQPMVTDILDSWMYLGRPTSPTSGQRIRGDIVAQMHLPHDIHVTLESHTAHVQGRDTVTNNITGHTYVAGNATLNTSAAYVDLYSPSKTFEQTYVSHRLGADYRHHFGALHVQAHAALDISSILYPYQSNVTSAAFAAGTAGTYNVGNTQLFFILRHEPDSLTQQVGRFLDHRRDNFMRYTWNDNGDLIPTANETGRILQQSGGLSHTFDRNLKRPTSTQLALGVRTPKFGPFIARITGIARMHANRYTVRYANAQAYTAQSFADPGGDGRGEQTPNIPGQVFNVYARDLTTAGTERYRLQNSNRPDYFLGLEGQIMNVQRSWWFTNISASAYLSPGGTQFGSYGDSNDPGVVNESSADPNKRIHSWGRYDADRSFGINILAGFTPTEHFSWTNALRYRDGQPFTRYVVANLPQGPTSIMAVANGAPRATFHMTLDSRLRYVHTIKDLFAAIALDGYNLFGSGTEILEDPRTGPTFRAPLEMVAPRTIMLNLEIGYQPTS